MVTYVLYKMTFCMKYVIMTYLSTRSDEEVDLAHVHTTGCPCG